MASNVEQLLSALLSGETADIVPQSRMEKYLLALLNGEVPDITPQSRNEALLHALCENGGGSGGGSGESVDAEKLDLYERYFRAFIGNSFQDWNPQPIDPNETATFEEAPEKYYIEVETRGIKYKVTGDAVDCSIYPELDLAQFNRDHDFMYPYVCGTYSQRGYNGGTTLYNCNVLDASRLTGGTITVNTYPGYYDFSFVALPDSWLACNLLVTGDFTYEQGLSFGTRVKNMKSNTFTIDLTSKGDKPVYVMEGFAGNLYLAKLNISAEHLVGIINNLADITGTGYTDRLNIGSHNIAKLTDEQIAIAEQKGWIVE